MWRVGELALVDCVYGGERGRALKSGAVTLADRLEYIDWRTPSVQLEPCAACGQPGCAPGNYLALRRAGDFVVWVPDERAHLPSPDSFFYQEPYWARRDGFPVFDDAAWSQAQKALRGLPSRAELKPLLWREAWLMAQVESKSERALLGEPGSDGGGDLRDLIVTDPHVDTAELKKLLLRSSWAADDAESSVEGSSGEILTMYFDCHPDQARILARKNGNWLLHLGDFDLRPIG